MEVGTYGEGMGCRERRVMVERASDNGETFWGWREGVVDPAVVLLGEMQGWCHGER